MDIEIIRKIKILQLKASFQTLGLKQKLFLVLLLASLSTMLMPHETYAAYLVVDNYKPVLLFDASDVGYQNYLVQISQDATNRYHQEQAQAQAIRLANLTNKVQTYLQEQGSPLADYTPTLVTLKNWKKIVAIANAESTLCRTYPVAKANCWGVGGSELWDMGNNLGQGVVSMNHFLNVYPKHSSVKYSQMSFERMNGLYKQPAAEHWLYNAQSVYEDLSAIEKSL